MTIKDNLDTAGVISTGGTRGRATFIPKQDAAVVARLRGADAILEMTFGAWPRPMG